ncbi:MAG: NAD(FAD)-dependent dehydrogenase, partial [Clostridia bacterium]|nr:NAD(FAD)-dependent dehydrogenase [Clostridia bacterium]
MERKLTCIICPLGCPLTVELADGKVVKVTGNTCK